MDCKDLLCVLVIYILLEVMKTRFSRENFTRKNNNLNIILQDGDGNIEIMPLKDIYDAIQQAKTASVKHTNHMHNESKKHTNAKHEDYKNNKTAMGTRIKAIEDTLVSVADETGHAVRSTAHHMCNVKLLCNDDFNKAMENHKADIKAHVSSYR